MLTLGGTSDVGWGVEHEANLPGQQSVCTVTEYARFRLLLPELQVDAQGSLQRDADGGAMLDRRWFAKTRSDLLFPHNRLGCLSKLASQWAIDSWIRREERDLDWVRKNQELLTRGHANPNVGTGPGAAVTNGQVPTPIKPTIPASVYGSRAFLKDQTSNALTLCRKIGKPLTFITFTCNPNWPEITSLLLPGQQAMDNPTLTSRVFHLKLNALIERLKNGTVFKRIDHKKVR